MRGKFIVIEGGDGSGKSSAVSWLKDELKGEPILFTREPGGTEAAEEIRDMLVKKREEPLDVFTELLLFEAARREHAMKKIAPALEAGTHVVCDRFSASTYAYQIVAGGASDYERLFHMLDAFARGSATPDFTIYLDVDPEVGIARKHSSGDELNVFDEKELAFYTAVRDGIKRYIKDVPHAIIDASAPQQEVREAVKGAIIAQLNSK